MSKFYVTMTDSFMSGWGKAEGKTNKLVLECDSLREANIVATYADQRNEMKRVSVRKTKPKYNESNYYTQYKTKEDMPLWYKDDEGGNE